MRRRIVGLLVAALALAGYIIATPQTAQAYPLTGTHSAVFQCTDSSNNGAGDDQPVVLTWQSTYIGQSTTVPYDYRYSLKLKKVAFVGGSNNNITQVIPRARFSEGQAETSMAGSSLDSPAITGSPIPAGTTKTDGVGGVSYTSYSMAAPADNHFRNFIRVKLQYQYATNGFNTCLTNTFFLDDLGGLTAGDDSGVINCSTASHPEDGTDHLELKWNITSLGNDSYFFELTDAAFSNGPSTTAGPDGGIQLSLTTGGVTTPSTTSVLSSPPSSNWAGPSPTGFHEQEGVGGVNFPTITFTHTGGEPVNLQAKFLHQYGTGGTPGPNAHTCSAHWELIPDFYPFTPDVSGHSKGASTDYNQGFTCGTQTGVVEYQVDWAWDYNRDMIRPANIEMTYVLGTGAKLVLDQGSSAADSGVSWANQYGVLSRYKGSSAADRTITAGEGQTISLSDSSWVRPSPAKNPATPTLLPQKNRASNGVLPRVFFGYGSSINVYTTDGVACGTLPEYEMSAPDMTLP